MALICAEYQRGCDQFVRMSLLKKRVLRRRNWEHGTCNYLCQLRWILKTWAPPLQLCCSSDLSHTHTDCSSELCWLSCFSPLSTGRFPPLPSSLCHIFKKPKCAKLMKTFLFQVDPTYVQVCVSFHKQLQPNVCRTCFAIKLKCFEMAFFKLSALKKTLFRLTLKTRVDDKGHFSLPVEGIT